MITKFNNWRKSAGIRGFGPGISHSSKDDWYVKFTPNFGFALRLKNGKRIRYAFHHGLQLVRWFESINAKGESIGRWIVEKQYLGKSRVKGEVYATVRKT